MPAPGAASSRLLRMPAPAVLADEAVLLEAGQHAVEVVLLDAHLLGHLGDRDPGPGTHELERLTGTCPAPAGTAAAPGAAGSTTCRAWARRRGAPRRGDAVERRRRRLEPLVLLHQRLQLLEALADLALLLVEEIRHSDPFSAG